MGRKTEFPTEIENDAVKSYLSGKSLQVRLEIC
jgi:hypothetical protein